MKLLTTLTILLMALSGLSQDKPPKRSNTIVVQFDNDSVAFSESYKLLVHNGYSVSNADRSIGFITTNTKDLHTVSVSIINGTARFTSTYQQYTLSGNVDMQACWCGIKGDYRRRYFQRLIDMVSSLSDQYVFQ